MFIPTVVGQESSLLTDDEVVMVLLQHRHGTIAS